MRIKSLRIRSYKSFKVGEVMPEAAGRMRTLQATAACAQRFLFREAPRILSPWVDRIFADLARDGVLPQMNLFPPDFTAVHERQVNHT